MVLLFLLLAGAWWQRDLWVTAAARAVLARVLPPSLGLELELGEVVLERNSLTVHELRQTDPAEPAARGPLQGLSWSSAVVRFDLLALLRADPAAIESVEVEGLRLTWDTERAFSSEPVDSLPRPPIATRVTLRDATVRVLAGSTTISGRKLGVELTTALDEGQSPTEQDPWKGFRATLHSRAAELGAERSDTGTVLRDVALGLSLDGSVLRLTELQLADDAPIESLEAELGPWLAHGRLAGLRARTTLRLAPGADASLVQAVVEAREDSLRVSVHGRDTSVEQMLARARRATSVPEGLGGELDADAEFVIPLADPAAASGAVKLSWKDASLGAHRDFLLDLEAKLEERRATLSELHLVQGRNQLRLTDTVVPLDRPLERLAEWQGRWVLDLEDLEGLLRELPLEFTLPHALPLPDRIRASARVEGPRTQIGVLEATAAGSSLRVEGLEVDLGEDPLAAVRERRSPLRSVTGTLTLRLDGAASSLAAWCGGTAEMRASFSSDSRRVAAVFSVQADSLRVPGLGEHGATARGTLELDTLEPRLATLAPFTADLGPFRLVLERAQVPLGSLGEWSVGPAKGRVEGLLATVERPYDALHELAEVWDASLVPAVEARREWLESGHAELRFGYDDGRCEDLVLKASANTLSIEGRIAGSDLGTFPSFAELLERPVDASLVVQSTELRALLPGSVPLATGGRASVVASLRGTPRTAEVHATTDLSGLQSGTVTLGSLHLDLGLESLAKPDTLKLGLAARGLASAEAAGRTLDLDASLERQGGKLVLRRFEGRSSDGSVELNAHGELAALFDEARGPWVVDRRGPVQAMLRVRLPQVEDFVPPSAAIRRLSGDVEADLRLRGTLAAPELDGSASLHHGELRLSTSGVGSLQALEARVELREDELQVVRCDGEIGAAPFRASGKVRGPFGTDAALDLRIQGEELLLYRSRGIKARADLDLSLTGTREAPRLSGKVELTDGRYTRKADLLGFLQPGRRAKARAPINLGFEEGLLSRLALDVQIVAREPFEVRSNVVTGALRPDLALRGTGELPELTGPVYVDEAKLSLPASSLTVRRGTLQFVAASPTSPRLDLIAESRMLGYDVQVALSGTADEPVVELSSVPSLPEEDLLLLVLAGKPPEQDLGRQTGEQALQSVATYLGRDLLQRYFGDESTESGDSWLSRLVIETGRERSDDGVESIEARFLLLEEFPSDNGDLFLEGERSVRSEYDLGLKLVFRFR